MFIEPPELTIAMAAFNGGVIVRPDLSVIDEKPLPTDIPPEVIKTLRAHKLDVWIYGPMEWYVTDPQGIRVDRETSTIQFPPVVVPDFERLPDKVIKIVGVSNDLEAVRTRAVSQSPDQDPRHEGRPSGDRGGDLRRHAGQRDAAVFARALPGGRRGVLRGIERRIDAGLKPDIGSVASVFVSRWDTAVAGKVREGPRNRLGIAIAERTYAAARGLLGSRAGSASTTPELVRSASSGPAREPRTRTPPTCSTSRHSPPR